jgi:hypothetical protein
VNKSRGSRIYTFPTVNIDSTMVNPIVNRSRRRGVVFNDVVQEILYETSVEFYDESSEPNEGSSTASNPLIYDFGGDNLRGFADLSDFARLSSSSSSDESDGSDRRTTQLLPAPPIILIDEYDASNSSYGDEDSQQFHRREPLDEYDDNDYSPRLLRRDLLDDASEISFFDHLHRDPRGSLWEWLRWRLGGAMHRMSRRVNAKRRLENVDGLAVVAVVKDENFSLTREALLMPATAVAIPYVKKFCWSLRRQSH